MSKQEHYIEDLEDKEGFENIVDGAREKVALFAEAREELAIAVKMSNEFLTGNITIEAYESALENMRQHKGRLAIDEL